MSSRKKPGKPTPLLGKSVQVGNWAVDAYADEDGHLTLHLSHADNSGIVDVEVDLDEMDGENCVSYSSRFSTNAIEKAYKAQKGGIGG